MKTHGAAVFVNSGGYAFVADYASSGGRASTFSYIGWGIGWIRIAELCLFSRRATPNYVVN